MLSQCIYIYTVRTKIGIKKKERMDIIAKYFYRVQEDIIPKILFDYVMFEYLDRRQSLIKVFAFKKVFQNSRVYFL